MKRYGSAVAAILLAIVGCAPGTEEDKPTTLRAAVSATSTPDAVAAVKLSVRAAKESASYEFDLEPPIAPEIDWSGGGTVAPGDYYVRADAWGAGGEWLYSTYDVGPFTVTQGSTTLIAMVAQSTTPPGQFWNAPPRIDALYVSTVDVEQGGTVQLMVLAKDPDPQSTLAYAWSEPEGAVGWFDEPAASRTTWNAPAEDRVVAMKVAVTDDEGATAVASFKLKVGDPTGKVKADVSFNSPPDIHAVRVDPSRIEAGQSATLSVTAVDPDGDPVSYYWSSTCDGWFLDRWASSTVFTPWVWYAQQACDVYVQVDDGRGGYNWSGSTLWIGPEPQPTLLATEIRNGSFEAGTFEGWTIEQTVARHAVTQGIASAGQTIAFGDYVYDAFDGWSFGQYSPGLPIAYAPTDGQYAAFTLNNSYPSMFEPTTSRMYQDLRLPEVPGGARLLLAWDMAYTNHAGGFALNQRFGVQLLDIATNVRLATVYTPQAGDPLSIPMTPFEADLTAWAGQAIRLNLLVAQSVGYFDHAIDNVRLVIVE